MTEQPAPLVSVVMIYRDAAAHLEAAVDSVLAQDHPALELLLCDDASRDAGPAIAAAAARARPDAVRLLHHPGHAHGGMSATRALGIAGARGDLVAFLDADDVWLPGHLSQQVALLQVHPEAGLVCGAALDWYSWRDPAEGQDAWSPLSWPPGTLVSPPGMLTALLHRGAYSTPTCSLLVRRELLLAVGGPEVAFTGMYEDQALLAKLHLAAPAVVSGARTALYRRHAASSTARAQQAGAYDPNRPNRSAETWLRWLADLPALQCCPDPTPAGLVQAALVPYDQPETRAAVAGRQLRRLRRGAARATGRLGSPRWGLPWRLGPVSRQFGYERGLPVDRHHIEAFLAENAHVVAGRVLEVGDDAYTRRYGGERVARADVLNVVPGDPGTTLVADLTDAPSLPSGAFDCVVLTQVLQFVYDVRAAVATLHRVLAPGGTLLLTVPGISPVANDRWGPTWYWSFTPLAVARLLGEAFGEEGVEVSSRGNVLTSTAFLHGLAAHELAPEEHAVVDAQFPMLVTARAVKPARAEGPEQARGPVPA